mmetsp:Transcript_99327/g.285780  ORF Transcript_99327/g.285780 Transcript_99327/m.285780 type:complete len:291 (+) Transcript_99327:205-1077(+)
MSAETPSLASRASACAEEREALSMRSAAASKWALDRSVASPLATLRPATSSPCRFTVSSTCANVVCTRSMRSCSLIQLMELAHHCNFCSSAWFLSVEDCSLTDWLQASTTFAAAFSAACSTAKANPFLTSANSSDRLSKDDKLERSAARLSAEKDCNKNCSMLSFIRASSLTCCCRCAVDFKSTLRQSSNLLPKCGKLAVVTTPRIASTQPMASWWKVFCQAPTLHEHAPQGVGPRVVMSAVSGRRASRPESRPASSASLKMVSRTNRLVCGRGPPLAQIGFTGAMGAIR